ncbi:MAG: DUF2232 domain-containing protein [Alphaproteobacteria bacterium]|nr:DUF2232 domain-containing protein [Alphaproteobacteria bacterium]
MKIVNSMFYSVFSGMIFFAILLLAASNDINFLSFILLVIVLLPVFLSAFWQGLISFLPIIITLIVIAFFAPELSLLIGITFILPAIFLSAITLRFKSISSGNILAAAALYSSIICAGILIYYGFIKNLSIHNIIYDTITFLSIYANQYIGEELESIKNLPQQLEIIAFILPTIITVVYIVWLVFNYHLALHISLKSKIIQNKEVVLKYDLPSAYTYIFILVVIFSLFTHNFLDNQQNLYYIFYNVLFILCFGYFYTGFTFLWNRIKSRNSFFINMLYIVFVVVMFIELIAVFSILGFIIETRRIMLKR